MNTKLAFMVVATLLAAAFVIFYRLETDTTVRSGHVQLSDQELVVALKGALSGNSDAADSLGNYFMWGEGRDDGLGLLFREQAALLGNKHSQKQLRTFLNDYGITVFREMTGRTNEAREQLLLEAIKKTDGLHDSSQ